MTGPRKPVVKPETEPAKDEAPEFIEPVAPEAVAPKKESKPEPAPEPEGWYPGAPCLNCGQTGYAWTTGWGANCSLCAPENQTEEE